MSDIMGDYCEARRRRPSVHSMASELMETVLGPEIESDTAGSASEPVKKGKGRKASVDDKVHPVFVDAAAMKERVRQNLTKHQHDVTAFYKKEGCFQYVARHTIFENLTLGIIGFNAIWIAIDTDGNQSEAVLYADLQYQIAENFFCLYFSVEWFIRFAAFRRKRDCGRDAWFIFDSILVLTMVLETWVMTIVLIVAGSGPGGGGVGNASILRMARLLRLSRMARMARLLRVMPELMIMIKGMVAAFRSVMFTLCLLIVVLYVFAIGFTQQLSGTVIGGLYFGNVGASMYNLLMYGTFMDEIRVFCNDLGSPENGGSWMVAGVFLLFVLLAALTIMNMLIGVLCEVVSAVAATEREAMLVSYVKGKVRQVMSQLDKDGDEKISKEEFVHILDNKDAVQALQDVGVDVVGLIDFADFIFDCEDNDKLLGSDDEVYLSFGKFMEVVLQLRGTNTATVKDVVDLRKSVRTAAFQSQMMVTRLEDQLAVFANRTLTALDQDPDLETHSNAPSQVSRCVSERKVAFHDSPRSTESGSETMFLRPPELYQPELDGPAAVVPPGAGATQLLCDVLEDEGEGVGGSPLPSNSPEELRARDCSQPQAVGLATRQEVLAAQAKRQSRLPAYDDERLMEQDVQWRSECSTSARQLRQEAQVWSKRISQHQGCGRGLSGHFVARPGELQRILRSTKGLSTWRPATPAAPPPREEAFRQTVSDEGAPRNREAVPFLDRGNTSTTAGSRNSAWQTPAPSEDSLVKVWPIASKLSVSVGGPFAEEALRRFQEAGRAAAPGLEPAGVEAGITESGLDLCELQKQLTRLRCALLLGCDEFERIERQVFKLVMHGPSDQEAPPSGFQRWMSSDPTLHLTL